MTANIYEVIIVGAGPGGSVAAKKCAQHGLRTLLLEKLRLPRYKVCSGMVMSRLAQSLVETEFGKIPNKVLATPQYLSGIVLHVIGAGSEKVEHKMPLTWRKDLDYWMACKAQEMGVELWDGARVTGIVETDDDCIVTVRKGQKECEVRAKFIIGADGATSIVRKSLFPHLRIKYLQVIQECYQGTLNLAGEYFHPFYYPEIAIAPSFDVHHKDNLFILDVMARIGEMKKLNLVFLAKQMLAEDYGFDLKNQPLWTKSCIQPLMYKELGSGSFCPCKGNVLLVGEAGGLLMPLFAGDGIREALWSGLLAATSILKAVETGKRAEIFYVNDFTHILSMFKSIYPWLKKIREQSGGDTQHLVRALGELWGNTLNIDIAAFVHS